MAQKEHELADKRAKARQAAKEKATADGWRGFVNVELSPDQKTDAKALLGDAPRLWDNIFSLVEDGYKLTVSHDDTRNAWNLSMTCRAKGNPNQGLTLSGRGGSPLAAAVSLWYKHDTLLMGVWGEPQKGGGGGMSEDDFD